MTASSPDLRDFSGLLVLVGAGKMGGALLEGWLNADLSADKVAVIEPNPSPEIAALGKRGVRLNPNLAALPDAAAIVIAVKPQTASEAMPVIAPMIGAETVVVSIMAGRLWTFSPAPCAMDAPLCVPCRTHRPPSAAA